MYNGQTETNVLDDPLKALSTPSRSGSEPCRTSFAAVSREIPWARFLLLVFPFHFANKPDTWRNWLLWCDSKDTGGLRTKCNPLFPSSSLFIIHYVQSFPITPSHPVQKILHINRLYIKRYKISSRSIKHPYPQKHKKFKQKNIFQKY